MKNAAPSSNGQALKSLTLRERKFLDALFLTTPIFNEAEAARAAGFSKASCRVQAVKILTKYNVKMAIEARQLEHQNATGITRAEWLRKVRCLFDADVRKLFDAHNNPIDIPLLGDNEAMLIESFEVVEDFTNVKKANGSEHAVPAGYTKKIRLAKPKEILQFVGKVMGYIDGEEVDDSKVRRSLQVTFVSSRGNKMQLNIGPDGKRRLLETNERAEIPCWTLPQERNIAARLGVRFVKSVHNVASSEKVRN